MAGKKISTEEVEKTTVFYLYDNSGKTKDYPDTWSCIVPGSSKKLNPSTGKSEFDDGLMKRCEFKKGRYETSDELEIEFLSKYNERNPKERFLSNGGKWSQNNFPVVSTKDPSQVFSETEKIREVQVEKLVEKQVIPLWLAKTLSAKVLLEMASKAEPVIEVPETVTEKQDVIDFLVEKNLISKE